MTPDLSEALSQSQFMIWIIASLFAALLVILLIIGQEIYSEIKTRKAFYDFIILLSVLPDQWKDQYNELSPRGKRLLLLYKKLAALICVPMFILLFGWIFWLISQT